MGILTIDSGSEVLTLGEIAVIKNIAGCMFRPQDAYSHEFCAVKLLDELRLYRGELTVTALRDMTINFFIKRFENLGSERKVHGADVAIYNMPWLDSSRHGNRFIPPHQLISVTTFYGKGAHEWKFYIVGAPPIIINLENNCHHMVQVKLPSGHICEAISTSRPLKTISTELLDDEWPYKVTITWDCFSRRYRYKDKNIYETDLSILKTLISPETVTQYNI